MIGVFFYFNWLYATSLHRLVDPELSPHRIAIGKRRALVLPAVALLAMVIAFVDPWLSTYLYFLIPLILWLPAFRN